MEPGRDHQGSTNNAFTVYSSTPTARQLHLERLSSPQPALAAVAAGTAKRAVTSLLLTTNQAAQRANDPSGEVVEANKHLNLKISVSLFLVSSPVNAHGRINQTFIKQEKQMVTPQTVHNYHRSKNLVGYGNTINQIWKSSRT